MGNVTNGCASSSKVSMQKLAITGDRQGAAMGLPVSLLL